MSHLLWPRHNLLQSTPQLTSALLAVTLPWRAKYFKYSDSGAASWQLKWSYQAQLTTFDAFRASIQVPRRSMKLLCTA